MDSPIRAIESLVTNMDSSVTIGIAQKAVKRCEVSVLNPPRILPQRVSIKVYSHDDLYLMTDVLDYEYWSDFLFREGAVCTPSELHGALSGVQCLKNDGWLESILTVLDIPLDEASSSLKEALTALHDIAAKALTDDQYGLKLMLPDDALPILDRSRALGDWCRGFLFGFGSLGQPVASRLDEEGQEAIRDIAKIAEIDEQSGEGEESEAAYLELVEYVRIVAITLYGQLNPASASSPKQPSLEQAYSEQADSKQLH